MFERSLEDENYGASEITTEFFKGLSITALAATEVADVTATINGKVDPGDEYPSSIGFYWRKAGVTTWTKLESTPIEGVLTENLTGLDAETDYEYYAFAVSSVRESNSEVVAFKTLEAN